MNSYPGYPLGYQRARDFIWRVQFTTLVFLWSTMGVWGYAWYTWPAPERRPTLSYLEALGLLKLHVPNAKIDVLGGGIRTPAWRVADVLSRWPPTVRHAHFVLVTAPEIGAGAALLVAAALGTRAIRDRLASPTRW